MLGDVAAASDTGRDVLAQNGDNLTRLARQGQEQLPLLARYAPEYPCLLRGLVRWTPHMEQAFRGRTLHIDLETLPNSPTGYTPVDTPRNGARNGPHCERLPDPPYSQGNHTPQPAVHEVDDGLSGGHGKFRPRAAARPGLAGLLVAPLDGTGEGR